MVKPPMSFTGESGVTPAMPAAVRSRGTRPAGTLALKPLTMADRRRVGQWHAGGQRKSWRPSARWPGPPNWSLSPPGAY